MEPPPPRRGRGALRLLLLAVVLWSLGLRLWYAWPHANPARWWDERYGVRNVVAFLEQPSYQPANGYYPTLSWLPQALVLTALEQLHERTSGATPAVRTGHSLTATGYRVSRAFQVLCGTACLLLTYHIGRRLGGPALGLIAAFLVATDAYHVRLSAEAKPDSLLWLLVLVAFALSLRAIDSPTLGAYLLAGAAIGLAPSAKWNAAPIAIPLTLATLLRAGQQRDRRLLLWLVAAGATAVAVFLLLQPWLLIDPSMYRRDFGETLRHYERKALSQGGGSHLAVALHFFTTQVEPAMFGPIAGTIGILGLVALGGRELLALASRRERMAPRGLGWLMVVVMVLSYVGVYSATTILPVVHNWIVLAPFVALAAAWAVLSAWAIVARRAPWLGRPALALPLAVLAAILLSANVNRYVYEEIVPTTEALALAWLRTGPLGDGQGRVLFSEVPLNFPARRGQELPPPAMILVDRLDLTPAAARDAADGELFYRARLSADDGGAYRARLARKQLRRTQAPVPGGGGGVFVASPFRARGEGLVLLEHPQTRLGDAVSAEWACADLPRATPMAEPVTWCTSDAIRAIPEGSWISIAFPAGRGEGAAHVRSGEQRLRVHNWRRIDRTLEMLLTPRFQVASGATTLELAPGAWPGHDHRIPLTLWRWAGTGTPR